MNAAVAAVVTALRIAETNQRDPMEPYKGYQDELKQRVFELRYGLRQLGYELQEVKSEDELH